MDVLADCARDLDGGGGGGGGGGGQGAELALVCRHACKIVGFIARTSLENRAVISIVVLVLLFVRVFPTKFIANHFVSVCARFICTCRLPTVGRRGALVATGSSSQPNTLSFVRPFPLWARILVFL